MPPTPCPSLLSRIIVSCSVAAIVQNGPHFSIHVVRTYVHTVSIKYKITKTRKTLFGPLASFLLTWSHLVKPGGVIIPDEQNFDVCTGVCMGG